MTKIHREIELTKVDPLIRSIPRFVAPVRLRLSLTIDLDYHVRVPLTHRQLRTSISKLETHTHNYPLFPISDTSKCCAKKLETHVPNSHSQRLQHPAGTTNLLVYEPDQGHESHETALYNDCSV